LRRVGRERRSRLEILRAPAGDQHAFFAATAAPFGAQLADEFAAAWPDAVAGYARVRAFRECACCRDDEPMTKPQPDTCVLTLAGKPAAKAALRRAAWLGATHRRG